ncbi:Fatty acid desaturase [Cupriavidus basilensis OR16]|uniref:Fatty acid desaturase n=1 Tax=Cupriavidus basilensis OR16 TaxID=1127483 RepID=H1S279_9BURK|nr:acyl-CoA desaturase [Cupriavidus basilensis]EHP43281.1 Fatty acid desaturase [Cupriavidus basilensis OR16]
MFDTILDWAANGLANWSWWEIVIYTLVVTHITIAGVTIYLHRCMAHRSLDLHPIVSHFFRGWLWLTTGMVTKEWTAIHRKHHAKCETEDDPHSPQTRGIRKVLLEGAELYRAESKNKETITKFGHGTPDDWVERNVYSRFGWQGVGLMLIIDVALFGVIGLSVWAVQMLWIPIHAAGIINGLGHWWGYRNYDCEDASTNVSPWGIIIGGEELHNNHHTYPTSAKFSIKWYEFDIGWGYIRAMQAVGLAKVKKTPPKARLVDARPVDHNTLEAIIANRYDVMARYAKAVKSAYKQELEKLKEARVAEYSSFKPARKWFHREEAKLADPQRQQLASIVEQNKSLHTFVEMRRELAAIWGRSNLTREQLLQQLQVWCQRAEASGIQALHDFSLRLRRYA